MVVNTPDTATVRWSKQRWALLLVLCTVLALDGLDVSMVGVALPTIGEQLGIGTATLQWVVSGYVLGYGSLLLLGGRLADLLGRRRIFLIALSVFVLASLLGGVADNPHVLIAARFIKGLAAAFTAPTGFSIITTNFAEGQERNKAISIYSVFGASGFSLGLIVGGLVTGLSWRWTMVFSVPFALVVLVLGRLVIPKDRPEAGGGHDLAGAVALPAGMLTLVYTVVSAPQAGWASPRTIAGFALAAAILALFVLIESRARHPLIRFSIMKQGWVARANLAAVALFGAYLSFQTIITLFLQSVLGWQPLTLALALLPAGLIVAGSAPFADRMIDRFGAPRLIMLGLVSQVIGYLLFLRVDTHPSYPLAILPSVLLIGLGFAMAFPSINVQATAGISNSEQGLAAGLVQTSTQVGAALVLAVTTAVVAGGMPQVGAGAGQMLAAYRPGLVLSALVALAGFAVVAWPRRQGHDPEPVTDAAVPVEPEQEREPVG